MTNSNVYRVAQAVCVDIDVVSVISIDPNGHGKYTINTTSGAICVEEYPHGLVKAIIDTLRHAKTYIRIPVDYAHPPASPVRWSNPRAD